MRYHLLNPRGQIAENLIFRNGEDMKEGNYTHELQEKFDVDKWLESEREQRDMCGSYAYCAYCDKSEDYPCANAYVRMTEHERAAEEPVTEETSEVTALGKTVDIEDVMRRKAARKSLSFAEKYALSDDIVKERYAALKAALTSTPKGTPKIKSRISRQCDTYRRGGDIVAKVTIIGGSLRINLPLDPEAPEFNDGKTPHTATGHKKVYAEVPFQFKVNSKLALKRALRLIALVK